MNKRMRRGAMPRKLRKKGRFIRTNGDSLRHMSDTHLAFFICAMVFNGLEGLEPLHEYYKIAYDWLQEPEEPDLSNVPHEAVCRVCGRTEEAASSDGCYWVEPDLCSDCYDTELEELDAEIEADLASFCVAMAKEDMCYLIDHTSPCGVCKHEKTDKCTGAENSSCFEWRGPK